MIYVDVSAGIDQVDRLDMHESDALSPEHDDNCR